MTAETLLRQPNLSSELPEHIVFISTPAELDLVYKEEILPYWEKCAQLGIDFETYSLLPPDEEKYPVPKPIDLPESHCGEVSNVFTRQTFRMEREGYAALIQLGCSPQIVNRQWVIDVKSIGAEYIGNKLRRVLENSYLIGHNLVYECLFLLKEFGIFPDETKLRDTLIIDKLLTAGRKDKSGLIDCCRRYIPFSLYSEIFGTSYTEDEKNKGEMQTSNWGDFVTARQAIYGAGDVCRPFWVYDYQKKEIDAFLKKHPRSKLLSNIKFECSLIPEVALMELRGIDFDEEYHRREVIPFLEEKERESRRDFVALCNDIPPEKIHTKQIGKGRGKARVFFYPEVNPRSTQQLQRIFAALKLHIPNTQADTLKEHRADHPIVNLLLKFKKADDLLSDFGYKLPRFKHLNGRIYASFRQIGTETNRFSSSGPNMQQIPAREKLFGEINAGELFRKAFTCRLGQCLMDCDYPNIEPKIIMQITGCKRLQRAFRDGVDFHGLTAQSLLDLPEIPAKGSHEREKVGKIGNLKMNYRCSWRSLQRSMYIDTLDDPEPIQWSDEQAKERFNRFFEDMPELKAKMAEVDAAIERKLDGHDSLAEFAGRKPIFTVFSPFTGVHRSFYLSAVQEEMARRRVYGDPRQHPLHRDHRVKEIVEERDPETGAVVAVRERFSSYNEWRKTVAMIGREAYNYLMQCDAANIMKRAMYRMGWRKLRELGLNIFEEGPIASIHDEFLFRISEENLEKGMKFMQDAMTEAAEEFITLAPVKAKPAYARNWADAKA
jgi:DNA polymerase I-like protein with 3'-5' exonuclease and polymerase domains